MTTAALRARPSRKTAAPATITVDVSRAITRKRSMASLCFVRTERCFAQHVSGERRLREHDEVGVEAQRDGLHRGRAPAPCASRRDRARRVAAPRPQSSEPFCVVRGGGETPLTQPFIKGCDRGVAEKVIAVRPARTSLSTLSFTLALASSILVSALPQSATPAVQQRQTGRNGHRQQRPTSLRRRTCAARPRVSGRT